MAIPLIDSLFRKNQPNEQEAAPASYETNETADSGNWKQYGFQQSRNHNASPIALDVELHKLLEQYKKTIDSGTQEQEQLKTPLKARIAKLEIDIDRSRTQAERIRQQKIPALEQKIAELKAEISDIRRNPEHYEQKPGKLGVILMGIILALLTVYLWIFYTSASYSAFFREFKAEDINVANSIFDPGAITHAWERGAPALVLVVTMPFIFLGLGVLMHKFIEETHWGKWIKLALVIIVTFFFDFIIAYEIVKKIYDLQALNSLEDLPPYHFSMAFSDINFWLIIFAGFVTYLIWGLLFEKFMTDTRKRDHAGEQIRVREREIDEVRKEIKRCESEAEVTDQQMHHAEKERAQSEADLGGVFFKPREVEYVVFHFMSGWMQFIEGGLMATAAHKDALRNQTRDIVMNFLAAIKPKPIEQHA
jgi:hypothetical protein